MRRWLLLLGAPLIWAAHFTAIYLSTSAGYLSAPTVSGATRITVVLLSVVAIAAAAGLAAFAVRQREPEEGFWRTIAVAGAILAILAVIWQTIPALAPIEGPPNPN